MRVLQKTPEGKIPSPAVSEVSSMMLFRVLWSAQEYQQAFDEMKRFSAYGHSEEYVQMMQEWKGV